jgi:arylsulfatase A-like enzyme/Tfp pilus assembly protein PilF
MVILSPGHEMKRKKSGLRLALALFCLVLAACSSPRKKAPAEPMNLLLISIDTLRADILSCYGGQALKTEAIDSLARKGILFERAFAHTPLTLPSHTNLLTGTLPLVHGVHDNIGFRVPPDSLTLAGHLKAQGYATAAFVSAYPLHSNYGLGLGFDVYDDAFGPADPTKPFSYNERKGAMTVSRAVDWIGRQTGRRWFVFLHLFDPHQPYAPPEPFAREFAANPYAGEVAYVDACLKKLFGYLEDAGLSSRTVIVLTADHGESFGEHDEPTHGYFAYNTTLHVPLMIRADGLIRPGKIDWHTVSHIDVFPTICDLLRVPRPGVLQGQSLLPLIEGRPFSEKPVYFESLAAYYNNGWAPLRGVILEHLKFIDLPLPELYDLAVDFQEKTNLLPGRSDDDERKALRDILASSKGPLAPAAIKENPQVLERMRSLGYLAGAGEPPKERFSKEDDLKTLLPYYRKLLRASALASQGDATGAARLLEELVAAKKDYLTAYEYLAEVHAQMGQYAEAVEALKPALDLAPGRTRLRGLLGLYLSQAGQQDSAIKELRQALTSDPEDPELWTNLGVACWKSGRLDEAEDSFARAVALDKNDPNPLNNLGTLALSRKNPDQAWAYFDQALALNPNLASAWNGKGAILDMRGETEGAVACWERAVAIDPDYEMALYNLGLALLRLGRPGEALMPLENYLRVTAPDAPDRPRIANLVKSLKAGR